MNADSSQGHADNITGEITYDLPSRQRKTFLPWHRPRKQFVRQHQWCTQIELLLNDSPNEEGVLRYLGLPGVDLLDLRHIHNKICLQRDLRLRFLGFNTDAQPSSDGQIELNISLDEVRRLTLVDSASMVIGDDFVRLSNQQSLAWKQAFKFGPYDVINLDLCDGFGQASPDGIEDTHYTALDQLLTLQARRKSPWLLLLTTRVGSEYVNPDVLQRFHAKYSANLIACQAFNSESAQRFGISDSESLSEAVATPAGMLSPYLCGLSKWIIGRALKHNPPTSTEVKSVIGYRVNSGAGVDDLFSLAFRLSPTFVTTKDPLGLASARGAKLDECSLAVKSLKSVAKRKRADEILKADPLLFEQMVEDSASLLESARYDQAEYREWVRALE